MTEATKPGQWREGLSIVGMDEVEAMMESIDEVRQYIDSSDEPGWTFLATLLVAQEVKLQRLSARLEAVEWHLRHSGYRLGQSVPSEP